VTSLLRPDAAADGASAVSAAAAAAGREAWRDAGGYYLRSISRIQTLWEARLLGTLRSWSRGDVRAQQS